MTGLVAISAVISRRAETLTGGWLTFGAVLAFTLMNAVSSVSTLRAFLLAIRAEPSSMTRAISGDGIAFSVFALAFGQTARAKIAHVTRLVAKLSLIAGFAEANSGDRVASAHFAFAGL